MSKDAPHLSHTVFHTEPGLVRVRFLKPWSHPTRDIVCGEGDLAKCSRWIADILIRGGYAEELPAPGGKA